MPPPQTVPQVLGLLQLQLAAHKALTNERRGKLLCKTLHTELVYTLSGSRHVGLGGGVGARRLGALAALGWRLRGAYVWGRAAVLPAWQQYARVRKTSRRHGVGVQVAQLGGVSDGVSRVRPLPDNVERFVGHALGCTHCQRSTANVSRPLLCDPTNLWPQIGESLKRFGVQDDTTSLLVARIGATPADVSGALARA